jgi:hypothetical protein
MSKPCRAIAENFDAWIENVSPSYRRAIYAGRATARRELLRQATSDREALEHQNALGIYEARAEAGE